MPIFFSYLKNRSKHKIHKTDLILQSEPLECAPASLAIILNYFGKFISLEEVRDIMGVSRNGINVLNIIVTARYFQLKAEAYKKPWQDLLNITSPAILLWENNHFLVLEGYKNNYFYLNDPVTGRRSIPKESFINSYQNICLMFKKTTTFTVLSPNRFALNFIRINFFNQVNRSKVFWLIFLNFFLFSIIIFAFIIIRAYIDDLIINKFQSLFFPLTCLLLLILSLVFLLTFKLKIIQNCF